jgi:hypothetical protein
MAKFLLLHSLDPRTATSEFQMAVTKAAADMFTKETYCIASWLAIGAGKIACLWEAPSEQALIDAYAAKEPSLAIDGIYPATVIDWAEMKKSLKQR